jgi:DNA-binding transcriptional LysR family regulator
MDHRYRKLLAVAETGSFSAAAKKLRVSQPAITLSIASLERSLGVKLCRRNKSEIELTESGKLVIQTAKKIANEINKMQSQLAENTTKSQLHVGIIDTIAQLLFASPKTGVLLKNIEISVDNSKRILTDLLANDIDAGLITGQSAELGKDFTVTNKLAEEFVFVRSPKIHNSNDSEIHDWLAFNKDSTSFTHFSKFFKKIGLQVTPIFFSTSMEILKDMAISGKGTALLPSHLVKDSINSNQLVVVDIKPMYRPIWAVILKDRSSSDVAKLTDQIDRLLIKSTLNT